MRWIHISHKIKQVFLCILSALLLLSNTAYAEEATVTPVTWPTLSDTIQAEGAILMDADSGVVLYGKNEHEHYYPASITKVLTAVIVLEEVMDLDEMVTFSADAVGKNLEANSTVIAASAGDRLSVRDCLYSLLLHSANDCANALAEHVAGSNEAFAVLMNEKAAEIGCTDSSFRNPSGLNDPEHYTSASDMAKIMQYAIQNEKFREIDAVQAYTHAPIKRYPDPNAAENTVYAHHRMMRRSYKEYYEGVFAGKTGYTMRAGNTLVTAAEREGLTLIAVILNGHNTQYSDTKKLFDFGYGNFQSLVPADADARYTSLSHNFRVDGISMVDTLEFRMDSGARIILPKDATLAMTDSSLHYDLTEEERADGAIARVDYYYDSLAIGNSYIRLEDLSEEKSQQAKDAASIEQMVLETVPESIAVGDAAASVSASQSFGENENHAPIVIDRESGQLRIQTPILRVLKILALIGLGTALAAAGFYVFERREEFLRKRRRARILKHTKDLNRAQKAKRDMMLEKRKKHRFRKR